MDAQKAQDMLDAVVAQRNRAENNEVNLMAELAARDRRIAELEAELKKSEKVMTDEAKVDNNQI